MKFFKQYRDFMQEQQEKELPVVGFKNLKKTLKRCRTEIFSQHASDQVHTQNQFLLDNSSSSCPQQCPVCDGTFFPSLLNEMSAIVSSFNERAQVLLDMRLAKGFRRCFLLVTGKLNMDHTFLIKECQDLCTYAMINAIAIRKILKKYDKIHQSREGQAFKSEAQNKHVEILQSPWLCELVALHINLKEEKVNKIKVEAKLLKGSFLMLTDGKPTLTLELFKTLKRDIDLTCSICLDTLFDVVALRCGHILCCMCACSAASVTIVDGLKEASSDQRCPLCREAGVYEEAVPLEELNILLSRSCPEYWNKRKKSEREERLRQNKEHWDFQHRAFLGYT